MGLKNTWRAQGCIKVFSSLMLEIKDMKEYDHLYHFMEGLQP